MFGPTTTNAFAPALAARVADSRDGTGGWAGAFVRGETRMLSIPGGRMPIGVTTLMVNVTAAGTNDEGYLTAFPCVTVDDPVPVASSVNFKPGVATANLVTVPLSATARICVYSSAPTDVIVDLLASFGAPGGLNALSVMPLALTPAFSPTIHDYTVPCAEGTNALAVSATAALDDATVTINGNLIGKATLASISVQENQAIVARVTTFAGVSDEYWIRCLPADFPDLTVTRPGSPQPGYYLTTTGFLASTTQSYVMILDENGTPIWYRKMASPPGVFTAARTVSGYIATVEPLGDAFGTDPDGAWHETTVDGFEVRSYRTVNAATDLHEFVQLSNGNVLLFSYPVRQHVDLTVLGNSLTDDEAVVDGHIQEIDQNGNLVWEWKSEDHIATAETTFVAQFPVGADTVTDLVHFNSIDVAPNGDLIVSSRHTDAVYRIDRSTGKIVWKMGGNAVVGDGAERLAIVGDPYGSFARQHDARLQPNGDITLFDNETAVVGKTARAVQYRLDIAAGTATMVWEHRKDDATNSPAMGSARRSANGDTVIAWGLAQPMLTEVDATGATLLEVTAPDGGNYRTIKYSLRDFDRTQLRLTAGPWPPAPS
ncbi:MAG: aryl-sulfate sulfotransferase [Acidimicrobiia bacterium]